MGMTNEQMLARLDQAVKFITLADMGSSVLVPEQFDRFVRAMEAKTVILPEARFVRMTNHRENIDRIALTDRILHSGGEVDGATKLQAHRELADGEMAKVTTATNQLIARETQAVAGIYDATVRRIIERGNFENTLVELMGEAAGRDLEEFGLLADTDILHADDDVLSLTDGWVKRADNKLYGGGLVPDFNTGAADWPENLFEAILAATPKKHLGNRNEWRLWVPWSIENDYRNLLKARGTALGDVMQTGHQPVPYKGIPVVYAPIIERAKSRDNGGDVKNFPGRVVLFGHPDNLVWGVFHEVTIEPERHARGRKTSFVMTIEADAHYEDETAATAAFLDQADPA